MSSISSSRKAFSRSSNVFVRSPLGAIALLVQKLSRNNYEDFVRQKRVAAAHFDAAWNADYRPIMRRRMSQTAEILGEHANFREVDWGREVELARSHQIVAVPSVVYHLDGRPAGVLGGPRNIPGRVKRLLNGEQVGCDDGFGVSQCFRMENCTLTWELSMHSRIGGTQSVAYWRPLLRGEGAPVKVSRN
jgi:hypothetical protein